MGKDTAYHPSFFIPLSIFMLPLISVCDRGLEGTTRSGRRGWRTRMLQGGERLGKDEQE